MICSAQLLARTTGRISFDKAAIMRHAHHEGRLALRACRTLVQRCASFSRWLRAAWAAAKAEAASLARQAEQAAAVRIMLAERARQSVALVASYGGAEGVSQAIASEHMRDRMNFGAVAKLETALASIGA